MVAQIRYLVFSWFLFQALKMACVDITVSGEKNFQSGKIAELNDDGKFMNNTFRGKDLFYVLQSDVSDIPKTPEPVVSANFLDTPFVKPNTDDTSNDNINFPTDKIFG